ncbi:contactin-associated protein-like 5, partial [Seriola lalandi dorsalis]
RSSSPDSRHLVSLGSLLDDQHWHQVAVEHHSNHLNLTVDKSTLWVQIPPRFTHWDHDQMSVGAEQGLGSLRSVGSNRNFHGCLENLVYNGVNLADLAKQRDQRVSVK